MQKLTAGEEAQNAAKSLSKFMSQTQGISGSYVSAAFGIAILKGNCGVALVRLSSGWSAPCALSLSTGAQVQSSQETVLLFMTQKSIFSLVSRQPLILGHSHTFDAGSLYGNNLSIDPRVDVYGFVRYNGGFTPPDLIKTHMTGWSVSEDTLRHTRWHGPDVTWFDVLSNKISVDRSSVGNALYVVLNMTPRSDSSNVADLNLLVAPPSSTSSIPQGSSQSFPQGNSQSCPQGSSQSFPQGNSQSFPQGSSQSFPQGNSQGFPQGGQGFTDGQYSQYQVYPGAYTQYQPYPGNQGGYSLNHAGNQGMNQTQFHPGNQDMNQIQFNTGIKGQFHPGMQGGIQGMNHQGMQGQFFSPGSAYPLEFGQSHEMTMSQAQGFNQSPGMNQGMYQNQDIQNQGQFNQGGNQGMNQGQFNQGTQGMNQGHGGNQGMNQGHRMNQGQFRQ